jgi:large conductance mechanosensitive channel
MKGFMDFIREQGVVGLAVGFILGGAVSAFVADFVDGVVNPLVAAIFDAESLASNSTTVGEAELLWGAVVASAINFVIIAAVVYYGVKGLGLDKADKKK